MLLDLLTSTADCIHYGTDCHFHWVFALMVHYFTHTRSLGYFGGKVCWKLRWTLLHNVLLLYCYIVV